jgi:AraC-like DNA-binding protein
VLGVPSDELRDLRVDLHGFFATGDAARLEDELSLAGSPRDAARVLERRLASLPVCRDEPDGTQQADAIRRRVVGASVDALADGFGVTTRTLHRRCAETFGYGPKTLQRILRFRTFLTLAERMPAVSVARLAADAGYADQPHLNRESQRLSGLSPFALLVSRGVRSVQDGGASYPGC